MTRKKINFANLVKYSSSLFIEVDDDDVKNNNESGFRLTYRCVVGMKIFTGHELRHERAFSNLFAAQHQNPANGTQKGKQLKSRQILIAECVRERREVFIWSKCF